MEATEIISAISTVGFPIVCCLMMFWQNTKQQENFSATVKEITETVQNNTVAITRLTDKLEATVNAD